MYYRIDSVRASDPSFSFEAFLPKEKKERAAVLEELKNDTRTLIVYERHIICWGH